jgi:hypothetical protein
MTTAKHGKPVPVVTTRSKLSPRAEHVIEIAEVSRRWEHCPKCEQVRAVGAKWKRACLPDRKATRYMGI